MAALIVPNRTACYARITSVAGPAEGERANPTLSPDVGHGSRTSRAAQAFPNRSVRLFIMLRSALRYTSSYGCMLHAVACCLLPVQASATALYPSNLRYRRVPVMLLGHHTRGRLARTGLLWISIADQSSMCVPQCCNRPMRQPTAQQTTITGRPACKTARSSYDDAPVMVSLWQILDLRGRGPFAHARARTPYHRRADR